MSIQNDKTTKKTLGALYDEEFAAIHSRLYLAIDDITDSLTDNKQGCCLCADSPVVNVDKQEAIIFCILTWKFGNKELKFEFTVRLQRKNKKLQNKKIENINVDSFLDKHDMILIKYFRQFGWQEELNGWTCGQCQKINGITIDMVAPRKMIDMNEEKDVVFDARFEIARLTQNTTMPAEQWCQCPR